MDKIFLIIIFLFPLGYLLYIIILYKKTKVPYVVTPKKYIPIILENLKVKPETIIFDLGCGKGSFLFAASRLKPKKLVGYELSPLHAWYARIKNKLLGKKIEIYRKDFFTADISQADIIYLFLVPAMVEKIWKKIKKEAKVGTQVVILSDKLSGVECEKIIKTNPKKAHSSKIYFYKI
ncbi:MAG: class I SAM-dependent methyltransferase [Patescibacteria group bacterium]